MDNKKGPETQRGIPQHLFSRDSVFLLFLLVPLRHIKEAGSFDGACSSSHYFPDVQIDTMKFNSLSEPLLYMLNCKMIRRWLVNEEEQLGP